MITRVIKYLPTIIFAVVLAALVLAVSLYVSERREKERISENLQNEVAYRTEVFTQMSLVKGELSVLKPHIDSVLKVNKIKEKQVEKIITYETHRFIDSVSLSVVNVIDRNRKLTLKGTDKCFSTNALLDLTGTSIYPTDEDVKNIKFYLLNTKVDDKGELIYYQKRDTTKWLKCWPFAKKKFYSKGVSECGGKVKVQEITFKKD